MKIDIPRQRSYAGERPWDVVGIDSEKTYGLTIVGHAQAGKTTLRNIIAEKWKDFDPDGEVFDFSNSNGFRGLTAAVLLEYGAKLSQEMDPAEYADLLMEFTQTYAHDLSDIMDEFYYSPQPENILRNRAVDKAVTVTAEHPLIRPMINEVGANYLRKVLVNPDLKNLSARPTLVVLDARSIEECSEKFTRAQVVDLGRMVLACPEWVIAARKYKTPRARATEAERLKQRNRDDRRRSVGRMTLAVDLSKAFYPDKIVGKHGEFDRLASAGRTVSRDVQAGIVMRTHKITLKQEARAVEPLIQGMLSKDNADIPAPNSPSSMIEYAHA